MAHIPVFNPTSVKIENMVASGSLGVDLDLADLSSKEALIIYGQNKYPGAYVKFGGHSVTIYRTGKYIIPGMKSEEELQRVFTEFREIMGR